MTSRRAVLAGAVGLAAGAVAEPVAASDLSLRLNGAWRQGGHVLGRTAPRAQILVDGEALSVASADGVFIVGLDRDAAASVEIEARADGRSARRKLDIAPHVFPSSRIDGLPPATVEPTDPALLERIRREVALKADAFASRADADDFRDGFARPIDPWRVTSDWGAQRILNGTPARPHYGLDLGAPAGTAIRAPAAGRIVLARSGLHFEGGLVLIDHGQGLVSAYLHQSRLSVSEGQRVRRGQVVGEVGMTGRATGPHLCWRLKWRDRNLDPSLMIGARAPA